MSLITQYNQPDETPLHSSGMANGSAPGHQSFTERKKIERERRLIKGYRFSMQGSGVRSPGTISKPQPRPEVDTSQTASTLARRQAFQAGEALPPSPSPSKYNPYA